MINKQSFSSEGIHQREETLLRLKIHIQNKAFKNEYQEGNRNANLRTMVSILLEQIPARQVCKVSFTLTPLRIPIGFILSFSLWNLQYLLLSLEWEQNIQERKGQTCVEVEIKVEKGI